MKFELKTDNEDNLKSFKHLFKTVFIVSLIIIFCDIALKLGDISRHYQTQNSCKLLAVEKTKSNFQKLSRLSKLKNKQRILEFCREYVR